MTALLIVLSVALYLAVAFIVAMLRYLSPGSSRPPTGFMRVFLAPATGIVWLLKKVMR